MRFVIPENPRYDPYRILPADFPETRTSVRQESFGTSGGIVEDNGRE
jgi:hypothetical protein